MCMSGGSHHLSPYMRSVPLAEFFSFSKALYHISCFNLSYVIFCSKTLNKISCCHKFPLFQQHLSFNSSTTFTMCTNMSCSHYSSCRKFSLIYVSFKPDPFLHNAHASASMFFYECGSVDDPL